MSKAGNPRLALGQLLASRILYALLAEEKQYKIARARFCTHSCSKVGQLLWGIPRQLLIPWEVAMRIKLSSPPPTPELLTKDFPSAARYRTKILTKEYLVKARTAPAVVSKTFTPLSKENQVSLVRTFLSDPGSESKMCRLVDLPVSRTST